MKQSNMIHYFSSIFSPKRMFKQRNTLNYGTMFMIFVFLVSCIMFPITLRTVQINTVSLEVFVPHILDSITDEAIAPLQKVTIQGDTLQGSAFQKGQVAGWLPEQERFLDTVDKGIYFDTIGFYIKVKEQTVSKVPYSQPLDTKVLTDVESIKHFISKQWFTANRGYAVSYILLSSAMLIATNMLLIVLGAAFFLWLTRQSKLFTIKTYKECLNLILNTLGMPTLLTCVILFMGIDIPTALQIHGFATVLTIVLVFYMTHYNDNFLEKKLIQSKYKD
ncbi:MULTISPECIES: DUF1189 family protein [unclassified Granulicatella]|uniref:DUF1189 family protein n=1 Tax=unclassified Granulicatella TaxID=2630493 RepID=UPI001432173B|nr:MULTISPECIES: DUF1189 family protein [unclassified Granulicatella]MBF0779647.1 DUF1189 family protein [Granulicatella sp. 19428wC4_WM01]